MAAAITERVRDHLTRQAAWLQEVLAELETLRSTAVPQDVEAASAILKRRMTERKRWESEQAQLLGEWRAALASVPELEQADVRAQSDRVRKLAKRVGDAYQRSATEVDACKKHLGEGLAQLGRGRMLLRRQYVENPDGWFVDRKA